MYRIKLFNWFEVIEYSNDIDDIKILQNTIQRKNEKY